MVFQKFDNEMFAAKPETFVIFTKDYKINGEPRTKRQKSLDRYEMKVICWDGSVVIIGSRLDASRDGQGSCSSRKGLCGDHVTKNIKIDYIC